MKVKVIGNIKGKKIGETIEVKEDVAMNLVKSHAAEPVEAADKTAIEKKIKIASLVVKNSPLIIISEIVKGLVEKVEKLEKIVKELAEKKGK
jgi:hypothetical protein